MSWDVGAWVVNTMRKFMAPAFTGGVPIVKSVQRGTVAFSGTGNKTITINEVNPDKCKVEIQSGKIVSTTAVGGFTSNDGNFEASTQDCPVNLSRLVSLSETSLVISSNYTTPAMINSKDNLVGGNNVYGSVSWQVTEYY